MTFTHDTPFTYNIIYNLTLAIVNLTDGNRIYFDINSGDAFNGLILHTIGHETGHFIRKQNAKGFRTLADAIVEEIDRQHEADNTEPSFDDLLKDKISKYKSIKAKEQRAIKYGEMNKADARFANKTDAEIEDLAYEDVVCDSLAQLLTEKETFVQLTEKIKAKDKGLWQTIMDFIGDLLAKFDKLIGDKYANIKADTDAGNAFRNATEEARNKIRDIYTTAFAEADANAKTAEVQTATISNIIPLNKANRDNILASYGSSDAEIMYSDRNDKYSYNTLVSKPDMAITTVDTSKVYNRADTVFEAKKNAAKIGTVHEDGSVSIHVKDIDADVIIGRKGLEHSLDRRLEQLSPITIKAGKILSNSIRINELTPKEKEASNSYILIGVAKDQINNTFIVEFVVNRYTNELMSIDVLHSINSNKKSTAVLNAPPVSTPDYRTKISISDLLDYVNRYFPDALSEDSLILP